MAQQILPILERDSGSSQSSAEGMLQIVHPNLRKPDPFPTTFPRRGHHAGYRMAIDRDNVRSIEATATLDHRSCNPIEDNKPVITVLHVVTRNDEYRSPQLGHDDFPIPAQPNHFLIAASRVYGEQSHVGKIIGKLLKQGRLLFPR